MCTNTRIRWRHLVPLLPGESPVFIADLPGYGSSAPIEDNSKISVGRTVLAALLTEYKRTSSKPLDKVPIVLVGHDRGARVAHHVTALGVNGVDIRGLCLIDIVRPSLPLHGTYAMSYPSIDRHRSPRPFSGKLRPVIPLKLSGTSTGHSLPMSRSLPA